MKRLSKEAEDRMLAAVNSAADLIDGGMHPNEAMAKAAVAHNVPGGQVGPMVYAYNIGRTVQQLHDGETVLEKAAEFELADEVKVREHLYPATVKSAAEAIQGSTVSSQYQFRPATAVTQREKMASLLATKLPGPTEVRDPWPRDPATPLKQAELAKKKAEYVLSEARREAAAADQEVVAAFGSLDSYFRKVASEPLARVRANVAVLHGEKIAKILDVLVAESPELPGMQRKQAAVTGPSGRAVGEPYDLVVAAAAALTRAAVKQAAYQALIPVEGEKIRRAEVKLGTAAVDIFGDPLSPYAIYAEKSAFGGGAPMPNPPNVNNPNTGSNVAAAAAGMAAANHNALHATAANRPNITQAPPAPGLLDTVADRLTGGISTMANNWWNPPADPNAKPPQSLSDRIGEEFKMVSDHMKRPFEAFKPKGPKGVQTEADQKAYDAGVANVYDELTDPGHMNDLQKIKSTGALFDTMARDEVIRGYDPREVAQAYNDIVELAPRIGDRRLALQALLRQRLTQGALDPFQVQQIMSMDESLGKQSRPGGGK